ncbi:antitoxin [Rodentibacter ratti]|uniref:Antitoxin n=1 Tax=Rodentibacter ratti TaxID=1906745 RepID=A0A1V3L3Z8_9PAST|nr:type II toxin-antitoxin system RelB/DinJ family antitoxin [Rodentibacter ratti]OOF84340.1 antitoxin [Rodentibacter ratti]
MAITQNTSFSFRLADSLKQEAFQVIENYGFTPSQVFNLFLTEIAKTKTIPVNLSYLNPNAETLRAMQEAENSDLDVISPAKSQESIMESLIKK